MPRLVESLRRLKNRTDSPPAFAKTETRTFTLPEQIAENVAEAIIAGTYPPGSWIAEQDLADQFGVSRGPIREALRILEKEALVQIIPRRGTMVTHLSRREVENIFSIRAALMALAGRQTAEQLTPEVEEELTESPPKLERLAQGQDVQEFLREAYRVSMLLARTSNNARLYELILSMARQTLPLTRMALDNRENRRTWAKNWRAIVAAIQQRDPEAAEKCAHRLVIQMGIQAAKFAGVERPSGRRNSRLNGRPSRRVT
jgi:DNA-binding GntR family transcriptional regulator